MRGGGNGHNRGIDWDAEPLGRTLDAELAARLGVDESSVRQARKRRGIARFNPDRDYSTAIGPATGGFSSTGQSRNPDRDAGVDVDVSAFDDIDGMSASDDAEPETLRSVRGVELPPPTAPEASPPQVRDWATPQQRAALDALLRYGSIVAAAEALGMTAERLRGHLTEADRRAARAGWSPAHDMTKPVPAGYHVKGVSTYYGNDGQPKGQWVKSAKDADAHIALLLDAVQSIAEPFKGRSELAPTPQRCDADLLAVYPMGDPHFGMYAWAEECGESFDLAIAERTLVAAVDQLVGLAPACEQALIINLGDFFHTDNATNRTARAGNALDVDGRWAKVVAIGIRAMRRCIDRALEKHKSVRVINEMGNHDDHSAIVLSLCLANYYENNPRVEIDTSPSPFHWLRFGRCLIGVTHGHTVKLDQLPGIMAADRPQDWGETAHRFWYTGHVHHDSLKEFPGCTVETFRTLAARDAWSNSVGYRSGRDMKLDVLDRERGRIVRHVVGIEQLPTTN